MARAWTLTDTLRTALGHASPDNLDRRTIPKALRDTEGVDTPEGTEDTPEDDEEPEDTPEYGGTPRQRRRRKRGVGTPDAVAGTGPIPPTKPSSADLLRRMTYGG